MTFSFEFHIYKPVNYTFVPYENSNDDLMVLLRRRFLSGNDGWRVR